jgi:hypothetical protein
MAGQKESRIINRIKKNFEKRYDLKTTVGGNNTQLKIDGRDSYNPDILFRDKKAGKITHIIEVETDPVRKALVGAAITADYCMKKEGAKPHLLFLIGKDGESQLDNFKAREKIIKSYLKNIKSVKVGDENEIMKILKGK